MDVYARELEKYSWTGDGEKLVRVSVMRVDVRGMDARKQRGVHQEPEGYTVVFI